MSPGQPAQSPVQATGLHSKTRFICPFIQQRLFNALTQDLIGDRLPLLALEPLDKFDDVFDLPELDLPALLERNKSCYND